MKNVITWFFLVYIAGFHMMSLKFKLENYWSSWDLTFMMYNYQLFTEWRWLALDIYRATKRQGKYPTVATDTEVNSCFSLLKQWDNIHHEKLVWMISSLATDANQDAIFSRVARR